MTVSTTTDAPVDLDIDLLLLPFATSPSELDGEGLVEGFVLGTYRYRRYKTADGFDGPSAFLVHGGEDYDSASVEEGVERGRHVAGF